MERIGERRTEGGREGQTDGEKDRRMEGGREREMKRENLEREKTHKNATLVSLPLSIKILSCGRDPILMISLNPIDLPKVLL